ncbi:ANTAR domain-containing protein [Streptomyces spinoverrucosus]|uniref:ANTAR domain-containing protein n=1 Tax=Streptomyces spinoverrucosus TaxID=284043 RepID=A0A4Y3VN24_9ACTN|nr:ANTAR domain-containing protein [Streptomyces spinoverrucosus]GHB94076.1 ANTAR domain-containing protein [Streptomyces spinoverrucosus]
MAPAEYPGGTRQSRWEDVRVARVPHEPAGDTDRLRALEDEVAQLKEAISSHAVVDQAIGMVVALGRVTPDQGWAVLKEVSQHTNIKLRTIAELILIWGRDGEMPPEIRAELEDALDRYGPTQIPGAPVE